LLKYIICVASFCLYFREEIKLSKGFEIKCLKFDEVILFFFQGKKSFNSLGY
jgi:hypothetical protein